MKNTKNSLKKILSFVLAALLLLCSVAFAEDGNLIGMPNPMVETDDAGMQAFGIPYVLPEDAENVQYFIIADELAEIRFTKGGKEYTVRMAPAAEYTDISGLYYDFEELDVEVRSLNGTMKQVLLDDGDIQLVEFYDVVPGIMYSVVVKAMVMNDLDLVAEAEAICVAAQGEVDGDETVVNPMVETDEAGMQAFGVPYVLPEDAENVQYFIIADELAEIRFTKGGKEYTVRMAPAAEYTDISGLYYDFEELDVEVRGLNGTMKQVLLDDGDIQLVEFYDVVPGIMYSVAVKAMVMNDLDLVAETEAICIAAQGEVDGDMVRSVCYSNVFDAEVDGSDVIATVDQWLDGSFVICVMTADAAGSTTWYVDVPTEDITADNGIVTINYTNCYCYYSEKATGAVSEMEPTAGKFTWQNNTLTWEDADKESVTFTACGDMTVNADYADTVSQRAVMNVIASVEDGDSTLLSIDWANSASETCSWSMTADIPVEVIINNDPGDLAGTEIKYTDCVCLLEKYDENGTGEYEIVYENGTGSFVLEQGDNGLIINWLPDDANVSAACAFEAICY